eukprot:gene2728-biopygen533
MRFPVRFATGPRTLTFTTTRPCPGNSCEASIWKALDILKCCKSHQNIQNWTLKQPTLGTLRASVRAREREREREQESGALRAPTKDRTGPWGTTAPNPCVASERSAAGARADGPAEVDTAGVNVFALTLASKPVVLATSDLRMIGTLPGAVGGAREPGTAAARVNRRRSTRRRGGAGTAIGRGGHGVRRGCRHRDLGTGAGHRE